MAQAVVPATYVSPLLPGKFDFQPVAYVMSEYIESFAPTDQSSKWYYLRIFKNIETTPIEQYVRVELASGEITGEDKGIEMNLESGNRYTAEYEYRQTAPPRNKKIRFTFQVVANQYPIKKQMVKEVLDRIFETVEPLCYDDTTKARVRNPRFHLEFKYPANTPAGEEERKPFNRISPEFALTHMTLREALQEVGKFIHAEPRLISAKTGAVTFDRYGLQQVATYKNMYPTNENFTEGARYDFTTHPYAGKRLVSDINTANTRIESDVGNFVNRMDGLGGTIAEPYRNGAITLRTDQAYLRFEDSEGSLYFPTPKGVMDVTSFKWVDIRGIAGNMGAKYDITPYVFEKTAYDAELSSYSELYPRSKAFGLYYTQGERHIRGFFFKNEKWNKEVFSNYAILNILEQVTNNTLTINDYSTLAFELVYTPIYNSRLSHSKSYTGDLLKKPMALSYNQSANVIETRYYGEHIKGVAQRLGNIEKTIVIHLRSVQNIPKIGQKWDDEYYISDVKSRFNSDRVICNVGLTKNFNRLSEYVGANSYKRYYEVSEQMSKERRTLYKDFLVITDKLPQPEKDCFVTSATLSAVANTFYQTTAWTQFVREITSCVVAQGFTKSLQPLTSVLLPVVSSAFGNVMEFTWSYKDNYSAGVSSTFQTNGKTGNQEVKGYFGAEVTYGDYYGQMYYQRYSLQNREKASNLFPATEQVALALPRLSEFSPIVDKTTEVAGTPAGIYRIIRKDSREVLTQSYAMEYVTDKKNVIIGSALARNNPMVGGIPYEGAAELWILPNPVNQFSNDEIDTEGGVRVAFVAYSPIAVANLQLKAMSNNGAPYLASDGKAATARGKAWAIISAPYTGEPYEEQDEDGNVQTVTPHYGGELLLAENVDIKVGDTIAKFNIVPTHNIFEFIKRS